MFTRRQRRGIEKLVEQEIPDAEIARRFGVDIQDIRLHRQGKGLLTNSEKRARRNILYGVTSIAALVGVGAGGYLLTRPLTYDDALKKFGGLTTNQQNQILGHLDNFVINSTEIGRVAPNIVNTVIVPEVVDNTLVQDYGYNHYSNDIKFKSQIIKVFADKNSRIKIHSLNNLDLNSISFSHKFGNAKHNSQIEWFDFVLGGSFSQVVHISRLSETLASCKVNVSFFSHKDQKFDFLSKTIHEADNTSNAMHTKGVLDDHSRASVNTEIKVDKNRANCVSSQNAKIILIGNNSKCDALPAMEVYNNQVACTHGASIGQVDNDQIFYLLSRGLSKESAKNLITSGFLSSIISLSHEEIKEKIHSIINTRLK